MNTLLFQIPVAVDSLAMDAVLANEPVAKTLSIIDLISSGGVGGQLIMATLALLSILTVYFFVERFQTLKNATKVDVHFTNQVKDFIADHKESSVLALCKRTPSPVAQLIAKGTVLRNESPKVIQDAMERQGNLEVYKLEHNLASLATIAGAAPMIGFLGTVIGMILAFHEMASAGGQIDVEMLSKGIYTAMTTTVAGLIVGIVAFLAYNNLVVKVTSATFKMEEATADFLEMIAKSK
ncbi:MotA/TolQ/ExbB proton channel family protein [Flavobacteriales bacterium]|nr:MotA/TolQ/ExbB proton channel family protein [Flavobacteriales bacterium]